MKLEKLIKDLTDLNLTEEQVEIIHNFIYQKQNKIDLANPIIELVSKLIDTTKKSNWSYFYKISILVLIFGSIITLAFFDKLTECQLSTLLATAIGFVIGKNSNFLS
jgi:hypothetical protein